MPTAQSSRPLATLLAGGFLLLPLANYVAGSLQHRDAFTEPAWLLRTDAFGVLVLVFPFVVGGALLLRRSLGWLLLACYAPMLVAFNLRSLVRGPSWFDAGALAVTVAAF